MQARKRPEGAWCPSGLRSREGLVTATETRRPSASDTRASRLGGVQVTPTSAWTGSRTGAVGADASSVRAHGPLLREPRKARSPHVRDRHSARLAATVL